jgi:hypothetical protein
LVVKKLTPAQRDHLMRLSGTPVDVCHSGDWNLAVIRRLAWKGLVRFSGCKASLTTEGLVAKAAMEAAR